MFADDNDDYGYSGVLPFSEFKKIICDESGSLKKVFEDNVRDFLGEKNFVNEDIENTINILTKALETTDFDREIVTYSSSW